MSNRPAKKPSASVQRAARARAAQEAPSRAPWIIGAVVLALVLTAGIAFAATRGSSSGSDAPVLDAQAQQGQKVARDKGCISCHTSSGDRSEGPTWKGIYGQPVTLTDGSTVTVDDAYLTRSVKEPKAQVVQGFSPMNAPKTLTDDEIAAVIAYIKALR